MYPTLQIDAAWAERVHDEMATLARERRAELDEATRCGRFPREIYAEMASRGWVGPLVPEPEGGLGGGVPEYCWIEEEVARHALVSPQVAVQGQQWLMAWGTPEQRAAYLPGIARGEIIFS